MCCSQPPLVFNFALPAVVVEAEVGAEALAHEWQSVFFNFIDWMKRSFSG
jgi:hypothetical protein